MTDILTSYAYWLITGCLLLILEVFTPGVYLMWFGFAAIIVGIINVIIPVLSTSGQFILFAIMSIIMCYIGWKIQSRRIVQENEEHKDLNCRDRYMIGKTGVIVELLDSNEIARAKFGETTWRVEGEHLVLGQNVTVYATKGITLLVK